MRLHSSLRTGVINSVTGVAKTILMICPFAKPNLGGVESHLDKLTSYLVTHGYRVYLLTYQPLTTKARGQKLEKRGNLEIHRVSWFGYGLFPRLESYFPLVFIYLFPGLFVKSLLFYLRHHVEIDCIHAHGFIAAAITRILVKIFPKRAIVSTHAIYYLENRKLLAALVKWMLGSFDKVLAVGEPSKRELIAIGLPQEKIEVHPNWVDLEIFRPLNKVSCRQALGPDGFMVLFVGRLLEKKGVRLLLEAADKLPKLNFVFVGDGPLEEEVRARASSRENVRYLGKVSDVDRIVEYYNGADLLVSLPLYDEGFATVYLEAIACGTPVVASNKGCLPYFIASSVGVLIDPTGQDTVETLSYYYEHPDELDKLKANCRGYALKHFSDRNIKVITRSYEDAESE